MPNSASIGIFDSGIGGLTLAHAITELMPNEPIIYFGDTAHLTYGDKSATAIQAYSVKICNLLLEKNCKLILALNKNSIDRLQRIQLKKNGVGKQIIKKNC